ncbi:MAG TPA: bifunctional phosphopantothenoylcysteine decarboxylase/phosphopantothenate--cysteine ligase CoaBC [Deltaproteobacteria bacterium]|nr:bifunctional phosphopantothenoylcysteine decarboxylase/phosphopantothenate--cysteine ligase CoaBC [Deltaproteobacteria bacterium]
MGNSAGEDLGQKQIVFGITGGIAAYKAPLVVRELTSLGLDVHALMTASSQHFVTPLTLQTLTGRPVHAEMFPSVSPNAYEVEHIALADLADLLLIAPATANCIAKLAHGIADDLLSCVALATKAPLLVCPSMNVNMLSHKATLENLNTLRERGVHILEPAVGELACGWEGAGRLPEPQRIMQEVKRLLYPKDLEDISIVITCGPTCEDIDPVRFITNRSTGKMGKALTEAACLRGARVKVISGPVSVDYAPWAQVVDVRSAQEMLHAVQESLGHADVLIMAAAVADYVPSVRRDAKIKKGDRLQSLELSSSPDILSTIKPDKDEKFFVGFAAETENLTDFAKDKMIRKGLDMIVANRVGQAGSGFASDTNSGVILTPEGILDDFEQMGKDSLAHKILDFVRERL